MAPFHNMPYPFVEMGWEIGEDIRPHAYTKQEWFNGPHAMFYYNVEEDKQVLLFTTYIPDVSFQHLNNVAMDISSDKMEE